MSSTPQDIPNDRATVHEVHEAQKQLDAILNRGFKQDGPTFKTIPVIDIAPSFSQDLRERRKAAKAIHTACTTIGFFYIQNHGIPTKTCDQALNLAKRFFKELPVEKKNLIHMNHSPFFRGWRPSELSQHAVSNITKQHSRPKTFENKEAFNRGYQESLDPMGGDGKYVELDGTTRASNLWPEDEDIPGFFAGIKDYYAQILQLSRHLFRVFALSLGLAESYFDHMTTHPGGIARLLYYPPVELSTALTHPIRDNLVGIRPHTDFECFTLLLQSQTSGLEVLSPGGGWISAEPREGTILVNIGDFLMRLTNAVYKSTVHRVINRTTVERYSIPFFFSINYDEIVETLPCCVSEENPSTYPPINAGRYILERLRLAIKDNE